MPHSALTFLSLTQLLQRRRKRELGAQELLEHQLARADRFHELLNAVVIRDDEKAEREAARLDRRHSNLPFLAGVSMTVKDHIDVAGLPSPCGAADEDFSLAPVDAPVVARLRAAGAIVYGKTNMPRYGVDWQSDNALYGRTNNPWDVSRTPGGSSGGAATAVAAGLTPLEVGSDTGGSIRIPATYCGVYGHRPSNTLLPKIGTAPGSRYFSSPLKLFGVQGPLARSAADLSLALDVMMGPDPLEQAWHVTLPPPRFEQLPDARVAFLQPFSWCLLSDDIRNAFEQLQQRCEAAGARTAWLAPDVVGDGQRGYELYLSLLAAQTNAGLSAEALEALRRDVTDSGWWFDQAWLAGSEAGAADMMHWLAEREQERLAWQEFFTAWDVLVTPVTLRTAFPHDPTLGPDWFSTFEIDSYPERYIHHFAYPALATLPGLPATAFPVGRVNGLPVGLQAIGPYLEDRTPLMFAALLAEAWGGFEAPAHLM